MNRSSVSTNPSISSQKMLDGPAINEALETCGFTHVVWIPDSYLGTWEMSLSQSDMLQVIRPTREGEAIAIAGGLLLGGARPIVLMQCTGLFEAGDALRNIVHDLKLPLILLIGVRGYLAHRSGTGSDNCPIFTEPILEAWKMPYILVDSSQQSPCDLMAALRHFQRSCQAGAVLIAE